MLVRYLSTALVCLALAFTLALTTAPARADLVRGLENYRLILKGELDIESLSREEMLEVITIHERLEDSDSGRSSQSAHGCYPAIESSINGLFKGWDGNTIIRLTNGQIWQQDSAQRSLEMAYNPKVLVYRDNGGCKISIEQVDTIVAVRRLR